jgi:hypothetical protein
MILKEFFRPTKGKIITFILLSIATLIIPLPADLPSVVWGSGGGTQAIPLILLYLVIAVFKNALLFFLALLVHLAVVYLITCLIFLIYNKFKK